ncbi:MAG: signal peptidase II [Desulfobacteraceae bacterium]
MKKLRRLLALPALTVVVLDQISKLLVVYTLDIHQSVPVVHGFFNLVHVRNRGMAFGLLNRQGIDFTFYFLIVATIGAIALMLFWFSRLKPEERRIVFGLSLIIGGAVANLIDRIRLREVVDFLDFYIGSYHWPAFNLADSAITVGTLWLAVNMIFQHSSKQKRLREE